VKLRAVLVDKDLNPKPVPKLVVNLRAAGDFAQAQPHSLTTGFDGLAETMLPRGRYHLMTPQGVEFQGKKYSWDFEWEVAQPESHLDLSNDNAKIAAIEPAAAPPADSLGSQFQRLKNSVVTVESEFGYGTGFFVDAKGIALTNLHVVRDSDYLAVQFDSERKVPAKLLASDSQNDIAVLWVNVAAFPDAVVAPVGVGQGRATVAEGDRVFTIGSPLDLQKILTTGVVSKVDGHAIISDININPGNSGGPLFTAAGGEAVGITTYREQASEGPGVTGIARIEDALPLLEQARTKISAAPAPAATLLPVEPKDPFPSAALRELLSTQPKKRMPYEFAAGNYEIVLWTPPLEFLYQEADAMETQRKKDKHAKKDTSEQAAPSLPPGWEKVAARIKPVLEIMVHPKLKEGFWGKMGRSYLASNGIYAPANVHFKVDFYRMRLLCGDKEIQPIRPGKAQVSGSRHPAVNITNAAFFGDYYYPPDSISPGCGKVALEIYADKQSQQATIVKVFEPEPIEHVWGDFEAYRKAQPAKSGEQHPK
jgi:hypothetical protein